jgi:hypothetical protein
MKNFNIGKKLYRSTALPHFKVVFLLIALWVLVNTYYKTYADPDFLALADLTFKGIINFHIQYPVQMIGFFFGTLCPAIYYAFFRGIIFHEEGVIINRGLPFLNHCVRYSDIESYKIIHADFLMSLKRKDVDEELMFTVRDIDRAVAILDQHGIQGELKSQLDKKVFSVNSKIVLYAFLFGIIVSVLQYTGAIIAINRYLFR